MYRKRSIATSALAIVLLGLMSASASADTILVQFNAGASSGNTFVYDVLLTTGNKVSSVATPPDFVTPDYFSVYDFAGLTLMAYVPSIAGQTFALTTEADDPDTLFPFDTGIANVRANYTGSGYTAVGLIGGLADRLGILTLTSAYTLRAPGFYASSDTTAFNTGATTNINGTIVAAVPLPPAVWGGLGLMGLMGVKNFRRQRLIMAGE